MLPRRKKFLTKNPKKLKSAKNEDIYIQASNALKWILGNEDRSLDELPEKLWVDYEGQQLLQKATDHNQELDYLIKKIKLLVDNPSYDKALAKILITDLLWHNGLIRTNRNLRVTEIVKLYEEQIQETYRESLAVVKGISSLPVYVRINTLVMSVNDAISSFCNEGWSYVPSVRSYAHYLRNVQNLCGKYFMKDFHISELLVFPSDTLFYEHPGYITGKFILQDKGSCLSSFLLNPKQDSVVLDVGAACGLKTNHIANILQGKGLVVANDIHPKRVQLLKEIMEVTQTNCVRIHEGDFITATFPEWFKIQYILLDATSTNSGIFFDIDDVKVRLGRPKLVNHQFSLNMLLRIALQKFPSIKRVVYTVCSMHPEEGEEVVDDALKTVGESFVLLNAREMLWNEWTSLSSPQYLCSDRCIRTIPNYDFCLSYFVAVFERNPSVPVPKYERRFKLGQKVLTLDQVVAVPNHRKPGRRLIVDVKSKVAKTNINKPVWYNKKNKKKKLKALARNSQGGEQAPLDIQPTISQDMPSTSAQS